MLRHLWPLVRAEAVILPCGCDPIWTSYFDRCVPCRNRLNSEAMDLIDYDRGKGPSGKNAMDRAADEGKYDNYDANDAKFARMFPRVHTQYITRGGRKS